MARLLPDTIDFSAYEQQTEASVKVRKASLYLDDVHALYEPTATAKRVPEMFSTKLRGVLGFRPGEVTAWVGFSGHKKSFFTTQAALDLCVQRQRVMIASFEMLPASTIDRMMRQASGVPRPARETRQSFSRWTDDRLWIFDHLGRATPKLVLAVCRYFAEELRGTHVFLDSLMMIVGSEEHFDEQKQFMTDLVRLAKEYGIHVHLIAHCRKPAGGDESKPPTKYEMRGSAALSDQADNVATVWANKAKKAKLEANPNDSCRFDPDALVTVEKQRNGAWEGRVKLWFDGDTYRFTDSIDTFIEPYRLEVSQ